jgi:hypothetical protein
MKPKNPWALTTYFAAPLKESEPATGKKAQPGLHLPFWFWGCEAFVKGPVPKADIRKPLTKDDAELPAPSSADEQAQALLVKNPDMPAATLLNTLKAEGIELVDKKEADSATTHAPLLKSKEAAALIPVRARFLESWKDNGVGPVRFKVALIQEGLGNLGDAFYYTREALESGITAFEGKKCFADHPSRSEESDRPERSVRDIVGHFESVRLEERDDGAAMLCADLVMLPDPAFGWARALVRHALDYSQKYPEQEFIGLSINASGDAESTDMEKFLREGKIPSGAKPKLMQALKQGITTVRVVRAIGDAVSTDLVTEPGARGKVLEMLETERNETMAKKMKQAEDKAKKLPAVEESKQAEEAKQALAAKVEADDEEGEEEEKPAAGEDHADAEQDKALILDMIKKHMGEACEGMEAEGEKAAHQAYEAYREMGKDHEEALKCAAEAMKLAKHMAAKVEAEKKAEAEGEAKQVEAEEETEKEEETKHSESVVKLTAKIAFLERELKKRELADLLDKKLAESKLGRAETDKLRALIGTPKSEAEITKTIETFKEAFTMGKGGSESPKSFASLFVTSTEKTEAANGKAKVSFADCVKI